MIKNDRLNVTFFKQHGLNLARCDETNERKWLRLYIRAVKLRPESQVQLWAKTITQLLGASGKVKNWGTHVKTCFWWKTHVTLVSVQNQWRTSQNTKPTSFRKRHGETGWTVFYCHQYVNPVKPQHIWRHFTFLECIFLIYILHLFSIKKILMYTWKLSSC